MTMTMTTAEPEPDPHDDDADVFTHSEFMSLKSLVKPLPLVFEMPDDCPGLIVELGRHRDTVIRDGQAVDRWIGVYRCAACEARISVELAEHAPTVLNHYQGPMRVEPTADQVAELPTLVDPLASSIPPGETIREWMNHLGWSIPRMGAARSQAATASVATVADAR